MDFPIIAVLAATLTIATPLVFGGRGALLGERTGVLNLGIEGTLYAGAFVGFLVASRTDSLTLATLGAVVAGALAGALMALLTVTLGVNQHVAGIGTTLLLVAACDFTNRLLFGGGERTVTAKFDRLFSGGGILAQYPMTFVAFLVLAPAVWWVLRSTGAGLRLTAVGENPEAADTAGISARTRWTALVVGGAQWRWAGRSSPSRCWAPSPRHRQRARLDLHRPGHLRPLEGVAGGAGCAAVRALRRPAAAAGYHVRLRLDPNELLIALPYLVVIAALAIRGRGVRYPGSYLTPYRRA